ncbi:MAG: 16S rRNA (guanine(966)-N(2))-methyltransferase RsmD [Burkholderiales bacterium]|nr:16S rRNA (guanine(966)-N(2))-methyltransferase RsmD [Burkholderiales bacterium]
MGKVRIIGGVHRSRILTFNDKIEGLRPTPDRVRETLFNWLGQDLTEKTCLDLFAGSGILGFEAVSRNATHVVSVEANSIANHDLHRNKKLLHAANLEIIYDNALHYIKRCSRKFDVIFLDPPYNSDLLGQSLVLLKEYSLLSDHGIIYVEYKELPDLANYILMKHKKAGIVNYMLIKPK